MTDEAAVERLAASAGPVDLLVNNAGAAESAPLARTDLALWRRMLETNATGAFLLSRAFAPGMTERGTGRIVNIASTAGERGYAYVSAYCAGKHALVGLTRALALELAHDRRDRQRGVPGLHRVAPAGARGRRDRRVDGPR